MKGIDQFLRRYHQAAAAGSKEIRMTMPQAAELAQAITTLMSRAAAAPTEAKAAPAQEGLSGSVSLDAGGFK